MLVPSPHPYSYGSNIKESQRKYSELYKRKRPCNLCLGCPVTTYSIGKVATVWRIPPIAFPAFIESHEGRMKILARKHSGRLGLVVGVRIRPTHSLRPQAQPARVEQMLQLSRTAAAHWPTVSFHSAEAPWGGRISRNLFAFNLALSRKMLVGASGYSTRKLATLKLGCIRSVQGLPPISSLKVKAQVVKMLYMFLNKVMSKT